MAPPESHVAGMIPVPGPRYPQGGPAVGNLPSHLPLPELSALAGPNGPNEYRLLDPNSRCHTSKKKGVLGVSAISMYYLRMKCIWFLYISLIYIYIYLFVYLHSLFSKKMRRDTNKHMIYIHIHMKCTYLSFQRQPSTVLRRSMIFLDAYLIIIWYASKYTQNNMSHVRSTVHVRVCWSVRGLRPGSSSVLEPPCGVYIRWC